MSNFYTQELMERLCEQALDSGLEDPKEIEEFIYKELDKRE